jgi:flagellar protein FlaI
VHEKHVNALNAGGKIVKVPVVKAMRREYNGKVRHIKLASGAEITVTLNHPFFSLKRELEQTKAEALEEGQFIATPKTLLRDQNAKERETEYWAGLLQGNGNLLGTTQTRTKNEKRCVCRKGRLSLFTEEQRIIPVFERFLKENFENTYVGIEKYKKENCYKVEPIGVEKAAKTKQLLRLPAGNRKTNSIHNSHYQNTLQEFVAGFFDAEGCVDLENNALVFACANEEYVDFIKYALLTQGIVSRKYESKSHDNRGYRLYVYGIEQLKKFYESFPLRFPRKKAKLKKLLEQNISSNINVDVIPCTHLIKEKIEEAKKKGVSEQKIARKGRVSQEMMRFLCLGKKMPSRETVEKIVRGLKQCGVRAKKLEALVSADIFWDKIVAVHEFEYHGFVYDLTVGHEKRRGVPHNFVAEGIFVGNSLGTVHANSSQETLVRVTSPPMNTPEMMLSGLDFIIVEHRIHDRKKGTIRRITEISEVTGVLEGKAQVQALFERDAAKDTITKTGVPSNYMRLVKKLSGLSQAELDEELKIRERFLLKLQKENIRNIREVSALTKQFLLEEREKPGKG